MPAAFFSEDSRYQRASKFFSHDALLMLHLLSRIFGICSHDKDTRHAWQRNCDGRWITTAYHTGTSTYEVVSLALLMFFRITANNSFAVRPIPCGSSCALADCHYCTSVSIDHNHHHHHPPTGRTTMKISIIMIIITLFVLTASVATAFEKNRYMGFNATNNVRSHCPVFQPNCHCTF